MDYLKITKELPWNPPAWAFEGCLILTVQLSREYGSTHPVKSIQKCFARVAKQVADWKCQQLWPLLFSTRGILCNAVFFLFHSQFCSLTIFGKPANLQDQLICNSFPPVYLKKNIRMLIFFLRVCAQTNSPTNEKPATIIRYWFIVWYMRMT